MADLVPVRRALISVSDKTGLADFASALVKDFHVELISTGGTAKFLRELGLPVIDVSQVTGFPEMMDGRVKTLHPKIHGGLLALRDNPEHVKSMTEHGISPIDLVCINLYPFKATIEKPGVTFEEAIENIDIGGPSMIRSAAKNHHFVLVVTTPERYEKVLGDLREHNGSTCGKHRLKMAQRAFAETASYDAMIANYLATQIAPTSADAGQKAHELDADSIGQSRVFLPELRKQQDLRYGENPFQKAALYVPDMPASYQPAEASVARAKQLHGKELSYINLLDADAALSVVKEFDQPAACVVKHATPCGVASDDTIAASFGKAYDGDPLAAFGGIVALNRKVDRATAEAITSGQKFLEVIVAPDYEPDALELLQARWKNVRLLAVGPVASIPSLQRKADAIHDDITFHKIIGGYLVQQRDLSGLNEADWKVASKRQPTEQEWADLRVAWLACKHVKSNAIVLAKDGAAVGIGGGQVDRVNASRIAAAKAGERAKGAVVASDAYFPFPDGPEILLNAGATAIIHPGGSVRDGETQALCDARGAALVLTGQRHFRH
ncbi:bifunctional phosphoribosylaminoimidazolecarboxamide formyltransferase/IMP cyclohydrolase [soil metagenome]